MFKSVVTIKQWIPTLILPKRFISKLQQVFYGDVVFMTPLITA